MERSQPKRALAALALAMTASAAMPAMAGPAIVADIDSGRVLYAEDATQPWHPASVTKLMTVYVALRALTEGRIGLETAIPVSKRASAAPPSSPASGVSSIGLKLPWVHLSFSNLEFSQT